MTQILRMSNLYAPTLKEDPSDADIDSARLLLRAGMLRKAASGLYTFLPLGFRVLKKIENIVREEMDASGAPGDPHARAAAGGAVGGERPFERLRPRAHASCRPPQPRDVPWPHP